MTATLASITHSVLEEHRRLQQAAKALDAALLAGKGIGVSRGVVAARVVDLRHQLARHFEAEEKSGLFEQIQRSAPETAGACARLRRQHLAILAGLDRARDELPAASAATAALESWVASVRAVLAEVAAHEQREDELLLDALERETGAPD